MSAGSVVTFQVLQRTQAGGRVERGLLSHALGCVAARRTRPGSDQLAEQLATPVGTPRPIFINAVDQPTWPRQIVCFIRVLVTLSSGPIPLRCAISVDSSAPGQTGVSPLRESSEAPAFYIDWEDVIVRLLWLKTLETLYRVSSLKPIPRLYTKSSNKERRTGAE